ncbi:MAG TPA: Lsr2 family protein [Acidimicrobiales bacterium]|jgi:hypothetical protein|nr:Lsr2 family protein [Acidimicrobiales bacterium]
MAKRQVVTYNYTCDVCGGVIPESEADSATHRISWEGSDYVIDVCSAHASQLDEILSGLKTFVAAGQRATGRRGRRPSVASSTSTPRATRGRRAGGAASGGPKRSDLSAVRAWARSTGRPVSERGRIPASLLEAYDAAQSGGSESPAAAEEAAPTITATPRKRGGRRPSASKSAASSRRPNLSAVRTWAREHGHTVSERGRIPASLLTEYKAATGDDATEAAPATPRKRGGRKKAAPTS